MAEGEWVPAFNSLWKGPKTARLAEELYGRGERSHRARQAVQQRHAAGGLFLELVGWALNACESGDLGTVAPAVLAAAVGLEARTGGTLAEAGVELLEALKAAGFLTDDDAAHVKGWDDSAGKLIARRAYERERKRARRRADSAQDPRTSRALGAQVSPGPRAVVPRDTGSSGARNGPGLAHVSHGARALVPRQSRGEERREEPPDPPKGSAGQDASAAGVPVDREAAAAFLIEGAAEPLRTGLEAFAAAHGSGALVTWFAGSTLAVVERGELVDGVAPERSGILTLANEFAAAFVADKFAHELRRSMDLAALEVTSRRRPMGEPGVLR